MWVVSSVSGLFYPKATWRGYVYNDWNSPVKGAKVQVKFGNTIKGTTYTNAQGYFSLSCYSPYFPDSCTLLFSKDGYTSKSLITSVKVRGVVDVGT